jgi:hypothetical protein
MGKMDSKGGGGDGVEADGFRDCRSAGLDVFPMNFKIFYIYINLLIDLNSNK